MNHTQIVLEARGTPGRALGKQRPSFSMTEREIIYPESDGKPMADNTKQFEWIVKIKEGLEVLFLDDPHVFVAGDLLWYPVRNNNKICAAPDTMVVIGRPKGDRGSYRQWEEKNIAPQVVFEILSPENTPGEMRKKLEFYELHGVEEYYLYDPDRIRFEGWMRSGGLLQPVSGIQGWVSPRLGIRFEITEDDLNIFRPDGRQFLTFLETEAEAQQERQRAEQAETALEQEKRRTAELEAKLKDLGLLQ